MPVAIGSNVPAWPAFCASNARRTRATACVEPSPCGLSRTTQPEIGWPFRLRPIAGLEVLGHSRVVEEALHPLGLPEALVVDELQLRRKAQVDLASQPPAQEPRAAVQRGGHLARTGTSQRLDEADGVL